MASNWQKLPFRSPIHKSDIKLFAWTKSRKKTVKDEWLFCRSKSKNNYSRQSAGVNAVLAKKRQKDIWRTIGASTRNLDLLSIAMQVRIRRFQALIRSTTTEIEWQKYKMTFCQPHHPIRSDSVRSNHSGRDLDTRVELLPSKPCNWRQRRRRRRRRQQQQRRCGNCHLESVSVSTAR